MSCLAKPSGNKGVREPLHELPLLARSAEINCHALDRHLLE
jgi:hypothetical protein